MKMPLPSNPSNSGEITQHGLHHVIQHNANYSYPINPYEHDDAPQSHSNYSTPGPELHGQPMYGYQNQQYGSGTGMQNGIIRKNEYPMKMYNNRYATPATTQASPQPEHLRTRSGLVVNKTPMRVRLASEARSQVDKPAPRPKRQKKEKIKAEKKVAKLDRPLSELTRDWTHVAVVDIEGYVNRSVEERRREVEEGKIPGKVKRPMNSFMLYRKAYQSRTKDWCLQNNHQVVSQVCGDSWPMEPEEIREQFTEWARIERMNHQNAHPGYKFSPSKPGAAKAAKRKISRDTEEPDTDASDLEDYDWRRGQSRKKARTAAKVERMVEPKAERRVAYPSTRPAYGYASRDSSVEPDRYHRSSWQANNRGRPMPVPYDISGLQPGQFYHQQVRPSDIPGTEDLIITKEEVQQSHGYLGLPGGQTYDNMMNPYTQDEDVSSQKFDVDTGLAAHEQGGYGMIPYTQPQAESIYFSGDVHTNNEYWNATYGVIDPSLSEDPSQYLDTGNGPDGLSAQIPTVQATKVENELWQVDTLDAGSEFDKWLGDDQQAI